MKTDLDRVERYLCLWAAWARSIRPRLGYPAASVVFSGAGGIHSFDDLCEQGDTYAARAVNGLIESLIRKHELGVRVTWLGEMWPYSHNSLSAIYLTARITIESGLNRKGLP